MTETELFVKLKHWLVDLAPAAWQPLLSGFISVLALIGFFAALFAVTTWIERKCLGRMQNRYGPNRVGPFGLLQPLADGIKSLTKEDVVPARADKLVHFLAPVVLVASAFLALAVVPIGRGMVLAELDAGLLYFFAVGAAAEISVFMAGWSSRNKYSLLGAMRAIAQMISYEVPLILSAVVPAMAAGSVSTTAIVGSQGGYSGLLPNWYVLTPWGTAAFLLFMIAGLAESNRSPFDLPEGESEIIAGYYIEYSGFKFALFFLGEYIGMFAVSGMAVTLFLGGWHAPAALLSFVPSYIWFFAKFMTLLLVLIWVRGTLPRLRTDQLMGLAWKFMLPLALINFVVASLWRFLPNAPARWLISLAILGASYFLLSRRVWSGNRLGKREYVFGE